MQASTINSINLEQMESPYDKTIVTTTSTEALNFYVEALECYLSYKGDLLGACAKALLADPHLALANVILATVYSFSNILPSSEPLLTPLNALEKADLQSLTRREIELIKAAKRISMGHYIQATLILEPLVFEQPNDMLATKILSDLYFFLGQSERQASHVNVERWRSIVSSEPQHANLRRAFGYVLGNHAFGLVEVGRLEEGDAVARESLSINPGDVWSIHARCHYFEMTKKYREAIDWLLSVTPQWRVEGGALLIHMWWHLALFYIGENNFSEASKIFCDNILPNKNMAAIDLVDASTLLWRLELNGRSVEQAWWDEVSRQWNSVLVISPAFSPNIFPMNLTHMVMAVSKSPQYRSGIRQIVTTLAQLEEDAVLQHLSDQSYIYRTAGVTRQLCSGLAAFADGKCLECIRAIKPIRGQILPTGGSIPQRSIYFQILSAAAQRLAGELSHHQ